MFMNQKMSSVVASRLAPRVLYVLYVCTYNEHVRFGTSGIYDETLSPMLEPVSKFASYT